MEDDLWLIITIIYNFEGRSCYMAKHEEELESGKTEKPEPNLKGTLISVGILGLFIIVSWVGVWALYLSR